jgi:hypothetical protein
VTLIGRIPKGTRKPEYTVDPKILEGKYILTYFGEEEIYGPFDSLGQLQEWAKANPDKADPK